MSLVCIDCRYMNGRPSGVGEMVAVLIAHLEQKAPELRFRLLVSPDAPEQLSNAPNVEEVIVSAAANGPGTMWWLPHLVDLGGVDLFHATYNIMPAGLAMPCLTTLHDTMWLDKPELCDGSWQRPFRRAFFAHGINRALARSAIIATMSEATRDTVIARRPEAAARTFATPAGVSERFRPAPYDPAALIALGLVPDRRYVLTVGQSAPYKNHAMAVRAFAITCVGRDDIDLVLVQRQGRGAQALLDLAADLGLEGRVHILSVVAEKDLIQLYSSAALLLHPSLCEGFGLPLAEAMACGCPVVTSDRFSMPEVTAGAAVLVDPQDTTAIAAAVARILDDPVMAGEMRKRGRERAAKLRWEDFAERTIALYRHILANHPR